MLFLIVSPRRGVQGGDVASLLFCPLGLGGLQGGGWAHGIRAEVALDKATCSS